MEIFWYLLTQVHLENDLKWRDRERERVTCPLQCVLTASVKSWRWSYTALNQFNWIACNVQSGPVRSRAGVDASLVSATIVAAEQMHKYQLCNNDFVKQRKYLRLIFEENFEVDVGAEDGVSCHPLQKHLMHRNRLLKRRQVFAETRQKGKGKVNHAPPASTDRCSSPSPRH